jgi:Zn-dependent protease with chaperone function
MRISKHHEAVILIAMISCILILHLGISTAHKMRDVYYSQDTLLYVKELLRDLVAGHTLVETFLMLLWFLSMYWTVQYIVKRSMFEYKWHNYLRTHMDSAASEVWSTSYPMKIIVISCGSHIVAASGLFKPYLVISTSALQLLNDDELDAVIMHEKYHCMKRHPLKKEITKWVAHCFTYVVLLRELTQAYHIWMEILADRYAMEQGRTTRFIGSALLKLIEAQRRTEGQAVHPYAIGFTDSAINIRLHQLLHPDREVKVPIGSLRSFISSGIIVTLLVTIVWFYCII